MKTAMLTAFLILSAAVAQADPIPDYVLQKDYDNCMGGETPQQDPQRSQYCSCVRDNMKGWDDQYYASLLMEQSKTQDIAAPIQDIAKACIQKVMH